MRISINFFKKIVICSLALFFAFGTKGSAQGNAQSFVTLPSSKSPLVNAVKEAAKEFQVPDRLLLAMAFEGRRFSGGNCKGNWKACVRNPKCINESYGDLEHPVLEFGPFGLNSDEIFSASKLLGKELTAFTIDCDLQKSVRAQAVLLKNLTQSHLKGDPSNPVNWKEVLSATAKQKWSSASKEEQKNFVSNILEILQKGIEGEDDWGNCITLPALVRKKN